MSADFPKINYELMDTFVRPSDGGIVKVKYDFNNRMAEVLNNGAGSNYQLWELILIGNGDAAAGLGEVAIANIFGPAVRTGDKKFFTDYLTNRMN